MADALASDMRHRAFVFATAVMAATMSHAAIEPTSQAIIRSLMVAVGERGEADVDYKLGFACDDPTILQAWMETRKARNWFIVEGVTPGRTWCRVGTDPTLPSYLFEITVVQRKTLPPRPPA